MRTSTSSDKIIVDRTRKLDATSKTVRDQRRQLTSNVAKPFKHENELLKGFATNQFNGRHAIPVFIAVNATISGFWIGWVVAIFWGTIAILSYLFLAMAGYKFLQEGRDDEDLGDWRSRFLIGQAMVGGAWALYAGYGCFNCDASGSYEVIQFSTILMLQAVTTISTYTIGHAVLIMAAPATVILATRFSFNYDATSLVMAGTACVALILFYFIGDRFKSSILEGLDNKAERETLIGELEAAKSMSEEARQRAEEANLAKSRFLATMSHELRTPLNAILGFSEVMKDEVLGPLGVEAYRDYIGDIHSSGSHLLNLINEILDISRIEAGKHDLHEEAMSLTHATEEAIHMVKIRADNKNINLESQFHPGLPQIWADTQCVRQIILNLLSNAVKFTPNGGEITVKVGWTSSGGQYISVCDTGPGIPEEEIPIVLSSFGQGSIAIKNAEQGAGLGLTIVQALVHTHEGKFTLVSKLREGTVATACFPQSRVLEVMAPEDAETNEKVKPIASKGLRAAS